MVGAACGAHVPAASGQMAPAAVCGVGGWGGCTACKLMARRLLLLSADVSRGGVN
jgi:hypothetical protein